MRKFVMAIVIAASSLGVGFAGTAHASLKSDCDNGDERACEKYFQEQCVKALQKEGFTKKAAQRECR